MFLFHQICGIFSSRLKDDEWQVFFLTNNQLTNRILLNTSWFGKKKKDWIDYINWMYFGKKLVKKRSFFTFRCLASIIVI